MLARKCNEPGTMLEWSLLAIGAAHPSKAFLQIPTLEEGSNRMFDDRPPEAVLGLITFIVDLLKSAKVLIEQTPQVGGMWIVDHRSALVPAIESRQLGARRGHGGKPDAYSTHIIAGKIT